MAQPTQTYYLPADPIISSHFSPGPAVHSLSRLRATDTPVPPRSSHTAQRATTSIAATDSEPRAMPHATNTHPEERTPLLLGSASAPPSKKPFYRPRPLWLVPFGIVASIVRGMTLAPRVQVYTQLACNRIYGHDVYDHTRAGQDLAAFNSSLRAISPTFTTHHTHQAFYYSLDPAGPHLDTLSLNLWAVGSHTHDHPAYLTFAEEDDADETDPRLEPSKRCLSDPAVQSGAAQIQTIMTTIMGALSAVTTGWWGHFGEQHGRMRVLAVSTLGLLLTDLTFILVSTPHSAFAAHGHRLLIIAPIIEGVLGGWTTLQAATSAYISDCTSDGSRAQIFSRFSGVFYLGFSVGPALGAYLIRHPLVFFPGAPSSSSGHNANIHNGQPIVTSVFYVAAMCSFVNLFLVLFVFPESIDKKRAKKAAQTATLPPAYSWPSSSEADGEQAVRDNGIVASQNWLVRSLSPLVVFIPKKIMRPDGSHGKDWSMTLLGIALFLFLLATGIFQIKYLYAEHVYEWGAEQLSYYITFVGAVRAVHLLFIMPHLIAAFKPRPKAKAKPSQSVGGSTVTAAAGSLHAAATTTAHQPSKPRPTLAHLAREMNFDLLLLRLSFIIECASHSLVSFAPAGLGQGFFVAFTTLSCFGAGVIPAANSLALCVLQMQAHAAGGPATSFDDDGGAGRLFGALAALQAVAQMILGPLVFGIVYSSTVATFPKGIFVTAASVTFLAVVLLCMLRPDVALRMRQRHRTAAVAREDAVERGRSRVSKDLSRNFSPVFAPQPPLPSSQS